MTLSLAATGLVSPPASIVEPAIALSIVVVGVDNLLVRQAEEFRDLRPWAAAAFGLVHGFGFAAVLREIGLPGSALGWSLFGFNLGVEIGQLAIVIVTGLFSSCACRHRAGRRARDGCGVGGRHRLRRMVVRRAGPGASRHMDLDGDT